MFNKCPNCGHSIAATTAYCRNCGMQKPAEAAAGQVLITVGLGAAIFLSIYFLPLLIVSSIFPTPLVSLMPELEHKKGLDVLTMFVSTGKAWVWALISWVVIASLGLMIWLALAGKEKGQ